MGVAEGVGLGEGLPLPQENKAKESDNAIPERARPSFIQAT